MSTRPARLVVATSALLLGLVAGCTSQTTQCSLRSCSVTLTGAQTFELDSFGLAETDVRVGPIEDGAVTVSAYGTRARLTPGAAVEVGYLRVELVSVSGQDVSLRVSPA